MNFTQPLTPVATRVVPPDHRPWTPLPYMVRGAKWLASRPSAGLPLEPGGRKTSITLAAFSLIKQREPNATMLVIAPLRVARMTWPDEVKKWTDFRDFRVQVLHGAKKKARLNTEADIYVINPEGVEWLCNEFFGRNLPFTIVAIDELTRFKNSQSNRSKALRPRIERTRFRWGLTGSIRPNTEEDVFGMQLMLDSGEALGRFITHFRLDYMYRGDEPFSWYMQPGKSRDMAQRLSKTWFYMDPADYAQLPPLVDDPREIELTPDQRKAYNAMKNKARAVLPGGATITAANAGAAYMKLAQIANGAVYDDTKSNVIHVHDAKIDALEDLIAELDGAPLLVAYEFNHDISRMQERFGKLFKDGVVPFLGKGTTATQERQWIQEWNANKLPLLFAHPASAGHGLNLQEGFAAHVCWFSIPWDWELYDQFIRRIRRSGNDAQRIFNHMLLIKNSIDGEKRFDKGDKERGQARLMAVLREEILRDGSQTPAVGHTAAIGANTMSNAKLPLAGAPVGWGAAPAQNQAPQSMAAAAPAGWGNQPTQPMQQPPQQAAPAGWGNQPTQPMQQPPQQAAPAGWGQAPDPNAEAQRAAMNGMLTTGQPHEDPHAGQPSPAAQAMGAFGGAVGAAMAGIAGGSYGGAPAPMQPSHGAPAGWGAPGATVQEAAQVSQQAAPAGWGNQPTQAAPQRERGKPSPGKARRTKEEMEEDAKADMLDAQMAAQGAVSGNQGAPAGWGNQPTNAAPAATDSGWQKPQGGPVEPMQPAQPSMEPAPAVAAPSSDLERAHLRARLVGTVFASNSPSWNAIPEAMQLLANLEAFVFKG